MRKIRRDAEINLRKNDIIAEYLKKLTKANDVYEPLEQKVDEVILKQFYLDDLQSAENIKIDDLDIQNNALYDLSDGKRNNW